MKSKTRRPKTRRRKTQEPQPQATAHTPQKETAPDWRLHWAAIGGLIVLLGTAYLLTLHPGLGRGDTADLQYQCAVLGICHDPGYHIEVLVGKLFSLLPLGGDIPWRTNFMMVITGVIGCLALYGAVRRISGRILAGLIAAGTLGFSSIYWGFCVLAEAYVFYGMFLLLAVYAVVRFIQSNRAIWLYLTTLSMGVCVADRPSEAFVLPGFLGLWLGFRRQVRISPRRVAVGLLIFVSPFAFSVAYHLAREDPAYLHARGNALRDQIVAEDPADLERSGLQRLADAVRFSLGLRWAPTAGFGQKDFGEGISRYARLLSGVAVAMDTRPASTTEMDRGLKGTSIGAAALLLVIVGCVRYRRQYGWILLGLGLFVGNLFFYLWYYVAWDGLTFTIPGLAGLALLAGLGAAPPPDKPRWAGGVLVCTIIGLLTPPVLLVSNYHHVNRADPRRTEQNAYLGHVLRTAIPQDSAFIMTWGSVNRYRYLLHVQGQRQDVIVMEADPSIWPDLIAHFRQEGRPTYVVMGGPYDRQAVRLTPPQLARLGIWCLNAPQATTAETP